MVFTILSWMRMHVWYIWFKLWVEEYQFLTFIINGIYIYIYTCDIHHRKNRILWMVHSMWFHIVHDLHKVFWKYQAMSALYKGIHCIHHLVPSHSHQQERATQAKFTSLESSWFSIILQYVSNLNGFHKCSPYDS